MELLLITIVCLGRSSNLLRTKNIVTSFDEVDEAFMFQFYLGLKEKLEGQPVETFTPLKRANGQSVQERTPSFFLFCDKRYFFKCYSTGTGGDIYELVRLKFGYPTKAMAIDRVWIDYQHYLDASGKEMVIHSHNTSFIKEHKRFHVESYEMRSWNTTDQDYWSRYYIGSKLLEEHYVSPLKLVRLAKTENGEVKTAKIERPLLYGYFRRNGDIYRLYQPHNSIKSLKIASYIQGDEQRSLDKPNLLITKSLKDVMGVAALKLEGWDCVAAESENTLIPIEYMETYKKRYNRILVLMDNDSAGQQATLLYKEVYGLDAMPFLFPEKDLTDALEVNGYEKVKQVLTNSLNP